MVQAINDFIRANWDAIRTELAFHGRYNGAGDAGAAIGEGFVNVAPRGAAPVPTYVVTSLFKIRIVLVEGASCDFFVNTAFPSAMGLE